MALSLLQRRAPGTVGCFSDGEAVYGIHLGTTSGEYELLAAYSPGLAEGTAFHRWVARAHLRHGRTNLACPPTGYRLLLVEAPDVPPEELRGAMRWKIKDLIDFHIDDAVIDVFDLPGRAARGAPRNLYVVAARRRFVQGLVDRADDAGLTIQAIDIPELCLRNVVAQRDLDSNGAAVLHLESNSGTLVLTREGTLHFARRLDLGYEDLSSATNVSSIILEVQRSLDYCDSHLDIGRPARLFVTPTPVPVASLLAAVDTELGLTAQLLRLADIISHRLEIDPGEEARLMVAAGAALRHEERRL